MNNTTQTKPDFRMLSMADLSRIARNEGEDIEVRRSALDHLNRRERRFCKLPSYPPPTNIIPGLC